jgi:hypothetical protein
MRKRTAYLVLLGIDVLIILALAVVIVIFEQLGYLQFYIGVQLYNFSPLDTWLIIILIFTAPIYIILIVLYNYSIIDVEM